MYPFASSGREQTPANLEQHDKWLSDDCFGRTHSTITERPQPTEIQIEGRTGSAQVCTDHTAPAPANIGPMVT